MRVAVAIALVAVAGSTRADQRPTHALPPAASGGTVVGLCDGDTSVEVKDVKPGTRMSRAKAQAVSDELMREWRRKHPEARWDEAIAQAQHGAGTSPQNAPPTPATGRGPSV